MKIFGIGAAVLLMLLTIAPAINAQVILVFPAQPCSACDDGTSTSGNIDCAALKREIDAKKAQINNIKNNIATCQELANTLQNRLSEIASEIQNLGQLRDQTVNQAMSDVNGAFSMMLSSGIISSALAALLAPILDAVGILLSAINAAAVSTFFAWLSYQIGEHAASVLMSIVQPYLDQIQSINDQISGLQYEKTRTQDALNRVNAQLAQWRARLAQAQAELDHLLDLEREHCLLPYIIIF